MTARIFSLQRGARWARRERCRRGNGARGGASGRCAGQFLRIGRRSAGAPAEGRAEGARPRDPGKAAACPAETCAWTLIRAKARGGRRANARRIRATQARDADPPARSSGAMISTRATRRTRSSIRSRSRRSTCWSPIRRSRSSTCAPSSPLRQVIRVMLRRHRPEVRPARKVDSISTRDLDRRQVAAALVECGASVFRRAEELAGTPAPELW